MAEPMSDVAGSATPWYEMPHGIERELAKYDQCEEPGDCDHDHDNAIEYMREQELAELRAELAAATARAETAEGALAAISNLHQEADTQDGDWEHGPHWPCVVCHDGPWPCATRRAADGPGDGSG